MIRIFAFLIMSTCAMCADIYVATTGNDSNLGTLANPYLTVSKGMTMAQAGDTVYVAAGSYVEDVVTSRSGTVGNRITLDGQGVATIKRMSITHSYFTLKDMTVTGIIKDGSSSIYMGRNGHFAVIDGCVVDNAQAVGVFGIDWQYPATRPYGTDAASDCLVTGCTFQNVRSTTVVVLKGDRNIVEDCILKDGYQIDFFRVWGRNNIIRNNSCSNNIYVPNEGNHPDFIQTFGNQGFGCEDLIIEGNIVKDTPEAQLGQLEGNLVEEIRNWTWRNNIFINIGLQLSCSIPGMKFYNNTFYRCNFKLGGSALNFGERSYLHNSIDPSQSEYATMIVPVLSGDVSNTIGRSYVVMCATIASGAISDGVVYEIDGLGAGESVTYNGVTYTTDGNFTGVAGVTTFSKVGTSVVYEYGSVTYNGTQYRRAQSFYPTATTTYTTTYAGDHLRLKLSNFAHNTVVKNNVFLLCGSGTWEKGWYAFSSFTGALTGIEHDYNYVSGIAFDAKRAGTVQYGDPAWDFQKFYEPHGVNGGDPLMRDISTFQFDPLVGSQLINAAVTLAAVTDDYDGTARPYGAGPDIGAHEYDTATPPPPVDLDVITPPSDLVAAAAGESAALLTWTDNSANETGFEIEKSLDNTSWVVSDTPTLNTESFTVAGLLGSTTYYFRVRAINATGVSTWSAVSVATTATPVILSGDVNVAWDDPNNPEGTITSYGVYLRVVADGPSFTQVGSAVGKTYLFDDLPVGNYQAKITAYRSASQSTYSNTIDISVGTVKPTRRGNPRRGHAAATLPP